ncbi:hypothetical protein OQA88_8603 [Cercophora sp. LCS_1]
MAETTPSSQRIVPGSFDVRPCPWPVSSVPSESVDVAGTAVGIIAAFNSALANRDYGALADLFVENGYWRDHAALSFDLRTFHGRGQIRTFLEKQCHLTNVELDSSSDFRKPNLANFNPTGKVDGIYFYITFTTKHGAGRGIARLVEKDSAFKIWTFFTTLESLGDHPEARGGQRPNGVQHGGRPGRKNWLDRRKEAQEVLDNEPAVLIIGAGQSGLTVAARLKMLGVPTLMIDRHDAVGDSWRKRYHQLVLHDPVWYDHLPYFPFPDFWPIFTPKDKVADWFAAYADFLELNVWMKSELVSASWDGAVGQWTATIKRTRPDGQSETRTLRPKHIIQATGHSGKPYIPQIPGIDTFQGTTCHSSEFPGAQESDAPRKAVVVGACNSSHDICQDYFEKGHSVTMVQRSTTCVLSSDAALRVHLAVLYEENSPPVEDADIFTWSFPSAVLKSVQISLCSIQQQHDAELLAGLRRAGFGLDNGPDEGGLFAKYLQRGGGYYIDVGTSQLIADGKIGVKHGQEITEILPNGLRFADGSELEADEIVFATGYGNMRTHTRQIFGDAVADQVGDIWGWDEEGEMRGIWKKSGHPGFWFMGGNMAMCRYYSRLVALQIKASLERLD